MFRLALEAALEEAGESPQQGQGRAEQDTGNAAGEEEQDDTEEDSALVELGTRVMDDAEANSISTRSIATSIVATSKSLVKNNHNNLLTIMTVPAPLLQQDRSKQGLVVEVLLNLHQV